MVNHTSTVTFRLKRVNSRVKYKRVKSLTRTWEGLVEDEVDVMSVYLHELIGLLVLRGAEEINITDDSVEAIWKGESFKNSGGEKEVVDIEIWERES